MNKKTFLAISSTLTYTLFCHEISSQNASYNGQSTPIYGTDNCGFGFQALNNMGSGNGCTATGRRALTNNNLGEHNTADGEEALFSNFDGFRNTASGHQALYNNGCSLCTGGNSNTGTGSFALYNNKNGNENTATGFSALYNNVDGNYNTASGEYALFNLGISGAPPANNNCAAGSKALFENLNGSENTACGHNAIGTMNTGILNTGIGARSLGGATTTFAGNVNTAIGYRSSAGIAAGDKNVSIGAESMGQTPGGSSFLDNTAIGFEALAKNIGQDNTAVGVSALKNNYGGYSNTAVGAGAISNVVYSVRNTAVGTNAFNTTLSQAFDNAAMGHNALQTNGQNQNTAIGYLAGLNNFYNNATAIGSYAQCTASNMLRLGNTMTGVIETQFMYVWPSDGRFKFNISDKEVKGLDFVLKLKPVVYNYDTKKLTEFINKDAPDSVRTRYLDMDFKKSTAIRQTGFIAQEVEIAAKEVGFDFSAVHAPTDGKGNLNEAGYYTLAYDEFVVPLVKAVQEQQEMIELQSEDCKNLKEKLEQQSKLLASFDSDFANEEPFFQIDSIKGAKIEAKFGPDGNINGLSFSSSESLKDVYLGIYEQSGKQIAIYKFNNKNTGFASFDFSQHLVDGFLCCLISENEIIATKKIVSKN
jgi:trimeric autotransporter adhesin